MNPLALMRPLALVMLVASLANANPARRFALVIGANRGDAIDQPLRFAEADAARMGRVLRDLGGFKAGDVVQLDTPDAGAIDRALADLTARIGSEVDAGRPPLLLFYYSGHADSDSIHTGGAHVTFDRLRGFLRDSRAAVRLAIVDACKSGALTRVKGMHAAPAIELDLANDLSARGEALLTSSTSDELARESDALRGSFFTHHLVSGLRGAADQSKDGRVTLAEAYEYAYGKTVAQAGGGQHPTFKYDLAGRGDVILTSLSDGGSWLSFASESAGTYLILSDDGLLLGDVEVGKAPLKIALAPGRYQVRKRTVAGELSVRIVLGQGEERWVHDEELQPQALTWFDGAKKGEPVPATLPRTTATSKPGLYNSEYQSARHMARSGTGLFVGGLVSTMLSFFGGIVGSGLLLSSSNDYDRFWGGLFMAQTATMTACGLGMMIGGGKLMKHGENLEKSLLAARDGDLEIYEDSRLHYRQRAGVAFKWTGLAVITLGGAIALGALGTGSEWPDGRSAQAALGLTGTSLALAGAGLSVVGYSLERARDSEPLPIRIGFSATPNGGGLSVTGRF